VSFILSRDGWILESVNHPPVRTGSCTSYQPIQYNRVAGVSVLKGILNLCLRATVRLPVLYLPAG
jgi:hypothetical protein